MSMLPVGIGSAEAGGYQIERSLRFNFSDSAHLNRTPASATNRTTWTYSYWFKSMMLKPGVNDYWAFSAFNDGSNYTAIRHHNEYYIDVLSFNAGSAVSNVKTQKVFRDPSAWNHMVIVFDTGNATQSDRVRIYHNGIRADIRSGATYPGSGSPTGWVNSTSVHYIGRISTEYFDGYLTEINFIDGQALTPSSFGETDTDTGVWKPKAYSGSYGTNGFYLKFADNSGTTSTTLGKDSSGNGNNWTPNNFSVTAGAGNDSLVDTPTPYGEDTGVGGEVRGNYCTLNPLDNAQGATLSNGNLQAVNAGGTDKFYRATFGMSSGKWYWEVQFANLQNRNRLGITDNTLNASGTTLTGDYALVSTGNQSYNTSTGSTPTVPTFATNDYICFAFDADAGILYFEKNATPNTSTSPKFTGLSTSKTYFVTCQEVGTASTNIFNFGQRAFQYTATSGFKALCTQNLPEPTIADGGDYFNAVLYTGNGSTQSITGVGFQPDFVWVKARSIAYANRLYDAVRGFTKELYSNLTDAESTETNTITAVSSDGFSLGNALGVNGNTQTFVAWNWKANGAGSSNTAGTTSATVSVNTTSGFSIITATTPSTYTSHTVGHGLGVTPAFIIYKERNQTSNWQCWHRSLSGATNLIQLTGGVEQSGAFWGTHTSTVIACGGGIQTGLSAPLVMYAFAEVPGYSAFGSYTGNNSDDGPFIYTGFRPAFFIAKDTVTSGSWMVLDNKRVAYNVIDKWLIANSSVAEQTSNQADFTSNGIKLRASNATAGPNNVSGNRYIYMAFAENPFKYSLAR